MKLREQRANIWEQMKALNGVAKAADRDFTAEEAASYDKMEADLDALSNRIERDEKQAKLEAKLERSTDAPSGLFDQVEDVDIDEAKFEAAFNKFIRNGMGSLRGEDRQIMDAKFEADKRISNAAGVGTGAAGGFTVAPGFRQVVIETMKYYGPMLVESEFINTDTGATMTWPTNDDTGNMGALLAENATITAQDVTYGQGQLDAYMYTSKLVLASLQFLQDSPNADTWLARKLGERLGRILNSQFTVGTGTTQPDGIALPAATVTGSGSLATTGGIVYANLIDLMESLDPAYGADPDCKWMMHQTARKAIRKLVDTTGRPIWEPSLQANVPDTLIGRPVLMNNDLATVAQNSKSLGFGSIKKAYIVREVAGVQLMRLTERYADNLQVGFFGFARYDGTLQDAGAFKTFQVTPTA